jgi:hypothetical protein
VALEFDPQDLGPQLIDLINEGRKLEGIDITVFGYFGGPELQGECIGRMQLDEEGRLPASNYDSPEERLQALVFAQSLRGALRQSIPIVLDGIFEDIFAIRTLEAAGGDTSRDTGGYITSAAARVVDTLPSAYRELYTSEFLQRFAVVLAEVAADFEMGWDRPRTFAHELAAYCFARKGVRYADSECGTRIGAVGIDRIMVGLLEDATVLQEAYHHTPGAGAGAGVADVLSWFEPYDAASRVNPYLHPEGQPSTEQLDLLEHQITREVTEKYPGTARQKALQSGELVDISPHASRYYFLCPVAVEQTVLEALGFNDLPANPEADAETEAEWQDVLLHIVWHGAAEHPTWKSYSYIAPGFDGEKAYIAAVAGTDELNSPVLTIQYLGDVVDDVEDS